MKKIISRRSSTRKYVTNFRSRSPTFRKSRRRKTFLLSLWLIFSLRCMIRSPWSKVYTYVENFLIRHHSTPRRFDQLLPPQNHSRILWSTSLLKFSSRFALLFHFVSRKTSFARTFRQEKLCTKDFSDPPHLFPSTWFSLYEKSLLRANKLCSSISDFFECKIFLSILAESLS
jgi:hypothetical protein